MCKLPRRAAILILGWMHLIVIQPSFGPILDQYGKICFRDVSKHASNAAKAKHLQINPSLEEHFRLRARVRKEIQEAFDAGAHQRFGIDWYTNYLMTLITQDAKLATPAAMYEAVPGSVRKIVSITKAGKENDSKVWLDRLATLQARTGVGQEALEAGYHEALKLVLGHSKFELLPGVTHKPLDPETAAKSLMSGKGVSFWATSIQIVSPSIENLVQAKVLSGDPMTTVVEKYFEAVEATAKVTPICADEVVVVHYLTGLSPAQVVQRAKPILEIGELTKWFGGSDTVGSDGTHFSHLFLAVNMLHQAASARTVEGNEDIVRNWVANRERMKILKGTLFPLVMGLRLRQKPSDIIDAAFQLREQLRKFHTSIGDVIVDDPTGAMDKNSIQVQGGPSGESSPLILAGIISGTPAKADFSGKRTLTEGELLEIATLLYMDSSEFGIPIDKILEVYKRVESSFRFETYHTGNNPEKVVTHFLESLYSNSR